jgi:muramoyltetrapeptide carboxypeptidase
MTPINDARIRPDTLTPGDIVGFVAPSRPVAAESVQMATRLLASWGLRATTKWLVPGGRGYLAGHDDDARAAAIEGALCDPEIRAVWCARGGYGAGRLLPRIDWVRVRATGRAVALVGYSDVTALHLAVARELRWVTLHGPVAALLNDGGPEVTTRSLYDALASAKAPGRLSVPGEADGWAPLAKVIRPGTASGPLTGGNLALVASLIGTPWAMKAAGHVVMLEDVSEAPYRIDRMLMQLRQSGALDGCLGIVFGSSPTCERVPDDRPSLDLVEILDELLGDLGVPVTYGWPTGHTAHQWTLPMGSRVTLEASEGGMASSWLSIDEAGTESRT